MAPVGGTRAGVFGGGIAIPDSVVDDLEDNDLSEWTNTTNVSITDTDPLEGDHSLQWDSPTVDAGSRPYSLDGDGLDYYPSKGDRFSVLLIETEKSSLPGFAFAVDSNTNGIDGYTVNHHPTNDEYVISRLDDGSRTELARPSITMSAGQIYEYDIQWHDGTGSESDNTIELTIYETDETADLTSELGRSSEVDTITVSDSTYSTNSGVGVDNFSSSIDGDPKMDRYWYLGDVE